MIIAHPKASPDGMRDWRSSAIDRDLG